MLDAFTGTADPVGQLKQEGDGAARLVRDSLDRLQPGLGNPVMKVSVQDIPNPEETILASLATEPVGEAAADREDLQRTLAQIAARLTQLEQHLAQGD